MRKIIKLIALPCILLGFISCEDEDKMRLTEHSAEIKGAFFRTVSSGGTIDKNNIGGSSYSITGELVSENTADVSSIAIMVEFVDRSTDGDPDTDDDDSIDPILVKTANVSDLSANDNGLLEAAFDIGITDALTALGLDIALIDGGDQFNFWVVINMTDGRTFRKENSGNSVTGELFFSSPMVYTGAVVCLSAHNDVGDWALSMTDTFGDGWDGAKITVNIDGVFTEYTVTGDAGTNPVDVIINIPVGTELFTFTYSSGSFEEEHIYTLTSPSGTKDLDEGPNPTPGELLNKCT